MQTLVGLYRSFEQAKQTMDALTGEGIDRNAISIMANNTSREYDQYVQPEEDVVKAGEGAAFGAAVGAGVGATAMLGMLAVPGIGPVIAAGPLVAALAGGILGAAAGAPTGGIVAGLVKTHDISDEDADIYAEGVRRGNTLLTVQVDDSLAAHTRDIMQRYDPINIEQEAHTWREAGWSRFNEDAQPLSGDEVTEYRVARDTVDRASMDAIDEPINDTYRVRSYDVKPRSNPN